MRREQLRDPRHNSCFPMDHRRDFLSTSKAGWLFNSIRFIAAINLSDNTKSSFLGGNSQSLEVSSLNSLKDLMGSEKSHFKLWLDLLILNCFVLVFLLYRELLFLSGDKCDPLLGDANTYLKKQPHYPRTTYWVSCLNSRTLFGPYGLGYQIAFCKQGSYYINLNFVDVEIGLRAPDCVGMNPYWQVSVSSYDMFRSQIFQCDLFCSQICRSFAQ